MATRKRRGNDTERAPEMTPSVETPPPVINIEPPLTPDLPIDPDDPSPIGDILVVDAAKMKALAAKGSDTTIARVRVEKFSDKDGRYVRVDGEYPPDLVTARWLRKKWGAGRYFCRGHSVGGQYLASGHCTVEALPEPVATAQLQTAAVVPAPSGGNAPLTFEQQLLLSLIGNRGGGGGGGGGGDDGLRETLAAMSKMIALQIQTATMNQVKGQLFGGAPSNGHSDDKFLDLLKELVRGQVTTKRESQSFGLNELLPVLQLGIGLGTRASGTPVKENPELPPWLQVVPDLADTIGVPLIATIAQATLPPDKAQAVLDAIGEHLKARKAEAEAETAAAGEPEE
jgi:hypothetical protein